MRWIAPVGVGLMLSVQGCTPTCSTTCQHYYEADQCDAPPAGLAREDAIAQCTNVCQDALQQTGPAPDPTDPRFNPAVISPPTKSPQITNEREAAAWMDCVWSFADDVCPSRLGDQYCVRVF